MVFRTIEGDLTKSGYSISIFRKEIQTLIRDVSNARGLSNKINAIFSKGLTDYDVKQLREYNKLINQGQNCQSAYYRTLQHTSTAAQELAMSANGAAVSEKTLETSTKSLSITQRIATTSSKVLAGAISLIGNIGIAFAINGIISLISYLVKREGELAENVKEASNRYKEQAKSLDELKNKYQEICDSEETEATKIANLNELKKELINNYGLTEDALKNLNTEREEGIKLLDEEISKMNRRDRNLLLNENREAYNKAVKKIENVNPNVAQDAVSTLNVDNISDNIKKMFSKIGEDDLFNWSGQVETYFEIDADNIIDQYEKIGDVISALTDKKNTYNGITDDEAHLLYLLNNTYKKLGKTIETHGDNYKDYYSYYAQNKFEDFESGYDFGAEGANDYNTYRKALLDSAGDDKRLKSEFEKILSDKFSNEDSNLTSQTEVTILPSVSADTSKLKSSLASLKEQINDIFKNTDLFDKAIESLNKGEAIDFDSVMSMAEVDGSLADKFIQTADGYTIAVDILINARQKYTEKTRDSIQADIEASKQTIKIAEQNIAEMQKKSDLLEYAATQASGAYERKKELDEAIQAEKQHVEELNGIIAENTLIIGEMENGVSSAKSSIEELSATLDNASKKQSLLKSAMEDMSETDYISANTYAELVEMGGNFADCLEVQNGKLVLNIEKLKELESAEYDTAIAAKELEIAKWKAINGASLKGDFSNQKELEEMEREKAFLEQLRDEWNSTKPDGSSSSSDKPQSVLDFEEELARRQHEIKMGRMEEDKDYFDWLENAYKKAYEGVGDCQDDLYKYEEMVYEGRKRLAEEDFNNKHEQFEKYVDYLKDYADELSETSITSDGTKLNTQEKYREIAAVYTDIRSAIQREINRIVRIGVEGNEELLEELEKQLKEYADKVTDTFKSAVETEKSLLENQKSS